MCVKKSLDLYFDPLVIDSVDLPDGDGFGNCSAWGSKLIIWGKGLP